MGDVLPSAFKAWQVYIPTTSLSKWFDISAVLISDRVLFRDPVGLDVIPSFIENSGQSTVYAYKS